MEMYLSRRLPTALGAFAALPRKVLEKHLEVKSLDYSAT
jgi:hypothetical protein